MWLCEAAASLHRSRKYVHFGMSVMSLEVSSNIVVMVSYCYSLDMIERPARRAHACHFAFMVYC